MDRPDPIFRCPVRTALTYSQEDLVGLTEKVTLFWGRSRSLGRPFQGILFQNFEAKTDTARRKPEV